MIFELSRKNSIGTQGKIALDNVTIYFDEEYGDSLFLKNLRAF